MTIDKAIRLLEALSFSTVLQPLPAYNEACKLGIEALKRIQWMRKTPASHDIGELPSETGDAHSSTG